MTLTDFLLARIAEDEEMARKVDRYLVHSARIQVSLSRTEGNITTTEMVEPYDPARALAECEAKRQIGALHTLHDFDVIDSDGIEHNAKACAECMDEDYPCPTLRVVAAVYSNHPDYRDEWKP